ncbi:MAG: hypothetical protein M1365_03230 [Actinobacteria bacterium]|nr:hypothetical protein [Actinomycetota bacterium]
MINVETLRKGPPKPEETPLPILKDEQVRSVLVGQLEAARALTEQISPFFTISPLAGVTNFSLFSMSAEEEMSTVWSGTSKAGVCERGKFQEIAFEVMYRYGFNPNVHKPGYASMGWNPDGTAHYPNGTSRECLSYPSQTIPGLKFERLRDYYTDTDETIWVNWTAEATKKPFSAHFGKH